MTAPARPRLSELLIAGAIQLDLQSSNKSEVLAQMVWGVHPLQDRPTLQKAFLNSVIEREDRHSTEITTWLSWPHALQKFPELQNDPFVAFGRWLNGSDRSPHLLFLPYLPDEDLFVSVMAQLGKWIHQPQMHQTFMTAMSAEEILHAVRQRELGV